MPPPKPTTAVSTVSPHRIIPQFGIQINYGLSEQATNSSLNVQIRLLNYVELIESFLE